MKLSVIIPSRNEQFLAPTVRDCLIQARGDVEVYVVLDGYWPDPPLADDPRLHVIHRGHAQGMRPAINAAAAVCKGDFLMKLDAHCALAEGYDVALTSECEEDWVVVPRRYSLEGSTWTRKDKPPVDAHFLSYPVTQHDGLLHGVIWPTRAGRRKDVLIDDEMSSQGSCWVTSRKWWERTIGPLDVANYGTFVLEFQEIGCKSWLGGGAVKINKKTWYAHLHKGATYGRGYSVSRPDHAKGWAFCPRYWMLDLWQERKRDLRWLIEHFAPVPTWPADLDLAFARAREKYAA